ncbi:uncharacterized protein LOC135400043 isoform X2 [Ornithodoros turicata]|uniref:uncharacterized protein LOC135400043 isoform X2 n=1 Tax=Ornithodoros turicata TaxID=34597 RepID=UPI003138ED32
MWSLLMVMVTDAHTSLYLSKKVTTHRVRLGDPFRLPCTVHEGVKVSHVTWNRGTSGQTRNHQASTGHLWFPTITLDASDTYDCTAVIKTGKREILARIRHDLQVYVAERNRCARGYTFDNGRCYVCRPGTFSPGGQFRRCIPCDYDSYTPYHGSGSCFLCPAWKRTFKQGVSFVVYAYLCGISAVICLVLFIVTTTIYANAVDSKKTILKEEPLSRRSSYQMSLSKLQKRCLSKTPDAPPSYRPQSSVKYSKIAPCAEMTFEPKGKLSQSTVPAVQARPSKSTQTEPCEPCNSSRAVDEGIQTEHAENFEKRRPSPSRKGHAPKQHDRAEIFKELLRKTKENAKRLEVRKNTPQPAHYEAPEKKQTSFRSCVTRLPREDFRRPYDTDYSPNLSPQRNVFYNKQRYQDIETSVRSSEVHDFFRHLSPERPSPSISPERKQFLPKYDHYGDDMASSGDEFQILKTRHVHSMPGMRRYPGTGRNWILGKSPDDYAKHKQHGPGHYPPL